MKFINLQTLVYLCKLERSKENKANLLMTLNTIFTIECKLLKKNYVIVLNNRINYKYYLNLKKTIW